MFFLSIISEESEQSELGSMKFTRSSFLLKDKDEIKVSHCPCTVLLLSLSSLQFYIWIHLYILLFLISFQSHREQLKKQQALEEAQQALDEVLSFASLNYFYPSINDINQ